MSSQEDIELAGSAPAALVPVPPDGWDALAGPIALAEKPAQLLGRRLNGRYELESLVGSGGTSWVFKARDLRKVEVCSSQPFVAVKILNLNLQSQPEARVGLEREAARAQQLAHPNIVCVFDFDRDESLFYLVMEWLSGPTLDGIIRNATGSQPVTSAGRLRMIQGLLAGLAHAHRHGLVHADFKPANVMLDANGEPRILDFGVARLAHSLQRAPGMSDGFNGYTPSYASVRRLKGMSASKEDDIYALACVIYELFSGQHPYGRRTVLEARQQKLRPKRPQGLSSAQWKALAAALDVTDAARADLGALQQAFGISPQAVALTVRGWPLAVAGLAVLLIALALSGDWLKGFGLRLWYANDSLPELFAEAPPERRQQLWSGLRQPILSDLRQALAQAGDQSTPDAIRALRERVSALGVSQLRDTELAGLVVQIDRQRLRQLQPLAEMLHRKPAEESLQGETLQVLEQGISQLRALDPDHPVLLQGEWRVRLEYQLGQALRTGRWSEALRLAESGQRLLPEDPVYGSTQEKLLVATAAELAEFSWPHPVPLRPQEATVRLLVEFLRAGDRASAQAYLVKLLESPALAEEPPLTQQLHEAFTRSLADWPADLQEPALRVGLEFFSDLGVQRDASGQQVESVEQRALRLVDTIDRGGRLPEALAAVQTGLQDLLGSPQYPHLEQRVRRLLQRQLAWAQGIPELSQRYQQAARALFPGEDWTQVRSQQGIQCRDQLVESGRLLHVCRDWLAPLLAGPEMLLISDLASKRSFYIGRAEVSVGEFNLFCRFTRHCQPLTEPDGLPATRLHVATIRRYAQWLSAVTGERYRLPTDLEWRLAAVGQAESACRPLTQAREVRAGPVDDLGLIGMADNVREFVQRGSQLSVRGGDLWDKATPCSVEALERHNGLPDLRTGFRLLREVSKGPA